MLTLSTSLDGKAKPEIVQAILQIGRYVNQLRSTVDANANRPVDLAGLMPLIRQQLQSGGAFPLNQTALAFSSGGGGNVTIGTHAQRIATAPTQEGQWFLETDRNALYVANSTPAWLFAAGGFLSSAADLPGDLGTNDAGFVYYQHDYAEGNVIWWWTGSSWYADGVQRGVIADIPAAANALAGSYYEATDFNRVYLCTGVAWEDAPGQDPRELVGMFVTAPGTGWALCDGSTVDMSTPTGGTTSYALPDLITATPFVQLANASGPGAAFGAVGAAYNSYQLLPYMRL